MFEKSIISSVQQLITGCERIRIAVIGAKESGKTVFLTALINHLRNHNENLLNLNGWSINRVDEDLSQIDDIPLFEYGTARRQLSNGEWPDNTRKISVARQKIRLTKHNGKRILQRNVIVELLDLPGERVADLSMVGRTFQEWSEWMERRFCGTEGDSPHFREYIQEVIATKEKPKILSAYKDCISKQYAEGLMTITPSVLKLSENGDFRGGMNAQDFRKNIENAYVGLNEKSQFAPLPQKCFKENSKEYQKIVKEFTKAFDKYKARIVKPIADWLLHTDKAIYLVDILSLLRRGPKAYNAEYDFANQTLRLFRRSCSDNLCLKYVQQFLETFVRTHVDGVYVVATKADTVVGDKNRSRLKDLARAMLNPTLMNLNVSNVKVLSCASVLTAEEYEKEGVLKARVMNNSSLNQPQIEEKQYFVSDVPMTWPNSDDWVRKQRNNEFDFRPTFPKFDVRFDTPPPQLGLDVLVRYLLDIS